MQPRITLETFNPDLPNLLIVRREETLSIRERIPLILHDYGGLYLVLRLPRSLKQNDE